jgi:hypothetical protein
VWQRLIIILLLDMNMELGVITPKKLRDLIGAETHSLLEIVVI